MTTHLTFGAGLVGGYIAGALLACGQRVSIVARPHVQAGLQDGLILTDLDNNRTVVPAPHFASPSDTPVDILWLTVKCTAVADAVDDMRPYVGPESIILCCQNGLGSEQAVRRAFPDQLVLWAMVPFNVARLADHHLHRGSGGALTLEHHPRLAALAEMPRTALMPLRFSHDMEATLWAKLQLNLVNAINALSDVPVKAMLEQRGYRRAFAACMRELLRVTEVQELRLPRLTAVPAFWLPRMLELPDGPFRLLATPMLDVDPTVRTSMWWDLSQGKATEIEHLNGAIVTHGRRLGVPTPVNERVVGLIRAVESGHRQPGFSPEHLLSELGLA
jgi:2-dehydropantoate 2-reductase